MSIWLIILLPLCADAESFIIRGEEGIRFKLWVEGQERTSTYVSEIRIEIAAGFHKCEVLPEGSTERISKNIGLAVGMNDVIYEVRNKKGSFIIRPVLGSGTNPNQKPGEMPNIPGGPVLSGSSRSTAKGELKFDWTFLDVGTVDQGGILNYSINVKSTGDADLVISDVTTGCACIEVLDFPRTGIAPGHFGKINIRITGPSDEGRQVEKVTVKANTFMGSNSVNIEFHVTGNKVSTPVVEQPAPKPSPTPTVQTPVNRNTNVVRDNRDGNTYRFVTIGNAVWFAENLRYKAERSYPHENASEILKHGYLYSWPAMIKEKVCPVGWHVATPDDWDKLERALGPNPAAAAKSKDQWDGTNSSGLDMLPSGNGRRIKVDENWKIETGSYGYTVGYWAHHTISNGVTVEHQAFSRSLSSGESTFRAKDEGRLSSALYYCRCVRD
ncbi:MAG: DUF1573 domain-containing protein [Flavobacteriales bacterium]|nr:DUF1573 domain-containing protein [Flavobacteriales bacterium]